jgi:hypothetical protein
MKTFLNLLMCLAFLAFLGCANEDTSGNFATPPGPYCIQSGGYGCAWQNYPNGFSPYPTGGNGAYQGYNGGGYANGFNGCGNYGNTWSPVYRQGHGLGCTNTALFNNGASNPYYRYSYGGSSAYQYCTVGGCPAGTRCVTQFGGNTGVCQVTAGYNYGGAAPPPVYGGPGYPYQNTYPYSGYGNTGYGNYGGYGAYGGGIGVGLGYGYTTY